MTRATVWVEANAGGESFVETVRARLDPPPSSVSVDVRPYYVRGPLGGEPPGAHPVYQHPSGDKCIWIAPGGSSPGYWFVPLDVGGEGRACALEHHAPPVLVNPKSFFLGVKPDEVDRDTLASIEVDAFTDRIYLAPWVDTRPPTHAQWTHEPTGAVAVVCSPFDVPGAMTDELEDVTCADCLRTIVRIYARER